MAVSIRPVALYTRDNNTPRNYRPLATHLHASDIVGRQQYNTQMRKTCGEELQDTLIIQALLPAGETVPS